MGNDGGSIPTRRDLVKDMKKEPSSAKVFENKQMSHNDLWTTCYLTGEKLADPIVSDYRGNLYNKEAVLRYLLDQGKFSEAQKRMVKHIKSLKDVVQLQRSFDDSLQQQQTLKTKVWICPVTQKDVVKESIAASFCYIVPCGHVFLQASLKEIEENQCSVCDEAFQQRDMVVINPDKQQLERLETRMQQLNALGLRHSLAKSKSKTKKSKVEKATKSNIHEEPVLKLGKVDDNAEDESAVSKDWKGSEKRVKRSLSDAVENGAKDIQHDTGNRTENSTENVSKSRKIDQAA